MLYFSVLCNIQNNAIFYTSFMFINAIYMIDVPTKTISCYNDRFNEH